MRESTDCVSKNGAVYTLVHRYVELKGERERGRERERKARERERKKEKDRQR